MPAIAKKRGFRRGFAMFDHNFLFMAFLMLCFAGLATMFYFMMRNIDELTRTLKEDRNQMQTNLRALESSLNHLADLLSRMTAAENLPRGAASVRPETLRAQAMPGAGALSGTMAMSGAASMSARNPESGPPDSLELRSAMVSPLRMADGEAAMPGESSRKRPAPASEPSGAYGGLSFDTPGNFGMNMDPPPAAASPMAAFAAGSAASGSLATGAAPTAAKAASSASISLDSDGPISLSGLSGTAGSAASDLSGASGRGSLPNLSLGGTSPVRRR